MKTEAAIPILVKLLSAADVEARRAAASSLRHTQSQAALGPLATALQDGDFEVRYLAVIGLAEITGQGEWRPLREDFKDNQERYIGHWQQWAKSHGDL